MTGRPDLSTFEVGAIYRDDETGALAEFIGTAWMPELDGEDVGIFRWIDLDGADFGCVVATQQSYEAGESFTRFGDVLEEERNE